MLADRAYFVDRIYNGLTFLRHLDHGLVMGPTVDPANLDRREISHSVFPWHGALSLRKAKSSGEHHDFSPFLRRSSHCPYKVQMSTIGDTCTCAQNVVVFYVKSDRMPVFAALSTTLNSSSSKLHAEIVENSCLSPS